MPLPEEKIVELHLKFPDAIDQEKLTLERIREIGFSFQNALLAVINKFNNAQLLSETEQKILSNYNDIRNALLVSLSTIITENLSQLPSFTKYGIRFEVVEEESALEKDTTCILLILQYSDNSNIITFNISKDLSLDIHDLLSEHAERLFRRKLARTIFEKAKSRIAEIDPSTAKENLSISATTTDKDKLRQLLIIANELQPIGTI